jgi:hypothetical protein
MNRWSAVRANIITALQAIPDLIGISVISLAAPTDVWAAIPEGTGIGVARRGTTWFAKDNDEGHGEDQPSSFEFDIVVKTDSPTSNADGLIGDGQSEDIATAVLAVRQISIGVPGVTGDVYLIAVAERVVLSKLRAEGGAGPIAQVITFRTSVVAL